MYISIFVAVFVYADIIIINIIVILFPLIIIHIMTVKGYLLPGK